MRIPFAVLSGTAALVALTACAPLPQVVYVPAPAPAPETEVAVEMPPVGVTIARADEGRLLVSTNQPAYLAVFELVPNRGVALVYPVTRAQRQLTVSGSSWLSLSRRPMRDERYARDDRSDRDDRFDRFDRDGRSDRDARGSSVRYFYAVASDRPLRLADAAFEEDYLREVLGARDYRSADPYRTIEALSRRFVAPGMDDEWGEDLFTIDAARPAPVRIAKVYCPDGSVLYLRDEIADRGACPSRGRMRGPGVPVPPAQRPDSVVASNGHAVPRPASRIRPPVFRVPTRSDAEDGVAQQGNPGSANGGRGNTGTGRRTEGGRPSRPDSSSAEGRKKEHDDNGNHYGRDGEKPDNNNNGNNGNKGNSGRGAQGARVDTTRRDVEKDLGDRGSAARRRLGTPSTIAAPVREHGDTTTMRRPQSEPSRVEALPIRPDAHDAPKAAAPADSSTHPKRFIPMPPRPAVVPDSAARPVAPDVR